MWFLCAPSDLASVVFSLPFWAMHLYRCRRTAKRCCSGFFPSRSSRVHERKKGNFNTRLIVGRASFRENCSTPNSLRNGPSPRLLDTLPSWIPLPKLLCHMLPSYSPPTTGTFHRIVNHTFTTKCNDDTIVHSPCFRCATRMRTRIDCQGSVRIMQNKVLQCGLTLKISISRAWKGEIG